jgi:FkbM family methyltransferase
VTPPAPTTPTASAHPEPRPRSRHLPRPLRALLRHPRVEPRVATMLRATVVRERTRFALRELCGARSTHVYQLRATGQWVALRHGTSDVHALDQAFYQCAHEPPPGALARLEALGRPLRALDLGAHVGTWGLWLHGRFPVQRLLALEPDPGNVAHHRRQIELNRLEGSWEVLEAAAVTADGPVCFTVGQGTNGRVTAVGDAAAVAAGEGTLEGATAGDGAVTVAGRDAFTLLEGLDLLKVDIEGGEWALLADPRAGALRVPVVMLEYHATDAPSPTPQADARAALERAGYVTAASPETQPGFGVVWGWRP